MQEVRKQDAKMFSAAGAPIRLPASRVYDNYRGDPLAKLDLIHWLSWIGGLQCMIPWRAGVRFAR